MTTPDAREGVALYAAAGYLSARDVICQGVIYHLLPIIVLGCVLTAYCAIRAAWCVRMIWEIPAAGNDGD